MAEPRRRRFSARERAALWWAAGGRCERCGAEIGRDFHADHVQPFSAGGATAVRNGAALCPACNLTKGAAVGMTTGETRAATDGLDGAGLTAGRQASPPYNDTDLSQANGSRGRAGTAAAGGPVRRWRCWQLRGFARLDAYVERGKDQALVASAPGAGKTDFAAEGTRRALERGEANFVVYVAPSVQIKTQAARKFAQYGIALDDSLDNGELGYFRHDPSLNGLCVTYGQVARAPEKFAALCRHYRVLVILDEVHHCAEELSWGERIAAAFGRAVFKLCLTGTPFRTRGEIIPFLEFRDEVDDDGQPCRTVVTDPELTFSMGDAVVPQPGDDSPCCRIVNFVTVTYAGTIVKTGLLDGQVIEETEVDSARRDESDRLAPLLRTNDGDLERAMLGEGARRLESMRAGGDARAGMLVTCLDNARVPEVARRCRALGLGKVVEVTSEMADGQRLIDRFRDGDGDVLVTVRMVAEGVDVPRLRVGVFLSNWLTESFFIQWVGRVCRWQPELTESQYAVAVIPAHARLVRYAKRIEEMIVRSACAPEEPREDEDEDDDDDGPPPPSPVVADVRDLRAGEGIHIHRGREVELVYIAEARRRIADVGGETQLAGNETLIAQVLKAYTESGGAPAPAAPAAARGAEPRRPLPSEQRKALRARTTMIANKIAGHPNVAGRYGAEAHRYVNAELNRMAGIGQVDGATLEQLRRRQEAGQDWLRELYLKAGA